MEVYESASSVKELGVGINVLPHAVRELTELGLLDELAATGIPTAESSSTPSTDSGSGASPAAWPRATTGRSSPSTAASCWGFSIAPC